ncbi:NRDE family protein [Aestuariivivens insulae]|uniref:NRDE family protein n=1 Tax=Aestuariivivens insulae TaxID=1621988 RepID=UPI001F5A2BFB|nr:NRDE family protein [Aestuariivivens insulae]
MCTVTIVPKGEQDFILTSNRDEAPNRMSLAPDFHEVNGTKMLFPKDELSGGTWIGISEKHRVVCVLNGGFERHKRQPNYRKSRGQVAKECLVFDNLVVGIDAYNFKNIEPFTMVLADWNAGLKFCELVWDGNEKHFTELPLEPKIWSSSTLYNQTVREERRYWFETFKDTKSLNDDSLLDFHKNTEKGNLDYGVIMDRGVVKTTSITQVVKQNDAVNMRYESLQNNSVSRETFNLSSVVNE